MILTIKKRIVLFLLVSYQLFHCAPLILIDHLVLLGNHYDAWTFGGVDPNSATAVILELARVIDQLRSTGKEQVILVCSSIFIISVF